jgi:uncharacterized protein (TIGR03067 family)
MHVRAVLLLMVLPSIATGQDVPDANKAEVAKLEGKWVRSSLESPGKKAATGSTTLEIKGDQWVVTYPGSVSKITYTVDASRTPKAMDMIYTNAQGREVHWLCIYKIEGDTLTLCRSTGERPTEFKAGEKGTYLIVWKRAKE